MVSLTRQLLNPAVVSSCLYASLFVLVIWLTLNVLLPLRRLTYLSRGLPGPPTAPLFGNLLQSGSSLSTMYQFLKRCRKTYGTVFRVWLLKYLMVFISDPVDIQHVLKTVQPPNRIKFLMDAAGFFGDGLATMRGESWRIHRKAINPTFHHSKMKIHFLKFEENAKDLAERLTQVADGRTIDMLPYASRWAYEGICLVTLGRKMAVNEVAGDEYAYMADRIDSLIDLFILQRWLIVPGVQWMFPPTREGQRIKERFLTSFKEVIVEKLEASCKVEQKPPLSNGLKHENATPVNEENGDAAIVDMLISDWRSGNNTLTISEVQEEIFTLILTGFITSAVTLSILLLLIGIHDEVLRDIERELEEVFGDDKLRPATINDLSRLGHLDRALKETLRLFPAVPCISRELHEDLRLPSGYTLPAGTGVFMNVHYLHHDPAIYTDPESFLPSRWLAENCASIPAHAYIPFSTGPRNCIGNKYATLSLKFAAVYLLRKFNIKTPCTMDSFHNLKYGLALKVDGSYDLQLTKK